MDSEKEKWEGEWVLVVAVTPEINGFEHILMGTFAVMICVL